MRTCDIIMKGGITSGVVYPLAVVELSEEFQFKNVGGTSAGAIAAAVTAAAEYRRITTGSRAGFDRIQAMPDFLAGKTGDEPNLLNLFPPTKSTRRLFSVLAAFLGQGSTGDKIAQAFAALVALSPLATLASLVPAVLVLAVMVALGGAWDARSIIALLLVEIPALLLGVVLLVAINALRALFVTIPGNRFGFSAGMKPEDRDLPGVTDWLHGEIQQIAGRGADAAPLTFGDLWLAGKESSDDALRAAEDDSDLRVINLQMMTTALSHGHPYRLPFQRQRNSTASRFYFRESEFREYFPTAIVNHLLARSAEDPDQDKTIPRPYDDLRALPQPWDLPIVVAARMSLSFPVLFCLVPLYAIDFTRKVPRFERCWFIDGGLSSNFPMSLFDSPFPRWPTFGINLGAFSPDYPKDPEHEENNVWMVTTASSGTSDRWTEIPERGAGAIGTYVGTILDAIRNWHDNTQLLVPGFRDRVALVKLDAQEGGLNLDMDATKVRKLSQRGRFAAKMLRDRFGAAGTARDSLNWNSHRWVRYKTSMALLQKAMRRMHEAFGDPEEEYPSYRTLVGRTEDANPKTGRWWSSKGRCLKYQALTTEFLALAQTASPPAIDFDDEAPAPRPELRITPQL